MRSTTLLLIMLAVVTATAACENEEARRRAEIAEVLELAAQELKVATLGTVAPGTDGVAEREARVQRVLSSLSGTRDAEGGQAAAASMLSAVAHRELAGLALAEAALIESQLSRDRSVIATRLSSAQRLMNLAEARANLDLERSDRHLADVRTEAESRRRDSSERMADLDGPIGELTDGNSNDRAQVDLLTAEASRLRREAAELGGARGFGRYEEAIGREREADQYEYRIAMREVDLGYDLEPEHRLASTRLESAELAIEAIDRSEENLRRFAESAADDADAIRERARAAAAEVRALLDAADGRVDGEGGNEGEGQSPGTLAALYQTAYDHLDKAIGDSRRAAGAAGRDTAAPAKMAGARTNALRGQTAWARAQGLTEHISLIEALLDAPSLTAEFAPALRSRRAAIIDQRDAELEAAASAYSEAESQIGSAGGSGSQAAATAFANNVKIAQASLAGEEIELPLTLGTGDAGDTTTPATPVRRTSSGPAASHEELIERLVAMDATEAMTGMEDFTRASSTPGRTVLTTMSRFMNAIVAQFGDDPTLMQGLSVGVAAGGGMSGGLVDVRLEREDEESAVYSHETLGGQRTEMTARRFDDGWYVEFESTMPDPATLAAQAAQAPIFATLTERLEAGEFKTTDEFSAAMMQAIMSAAGERGGAAPGGRRAPGPGPR